MLPQVKFYLLIGLGQQCVPDTGPIVSLCRSDWHCFMVYGLLIICILHCWIEWDPAIILEAMHHMLE